MRTFAWTLLSEVEDLDAGRLMDGYESAIFPCRDGWEHVCETHHALDFTKVSVEKMYNMKGIRFLGTLIVLEENDTLHVPLKHTTIPKRRKGVKRAFQEEASYNAIVDSNVLICDALIGLLNGESPEFIVLKVGLRHQERMFVQKSGAPRFHRGHANILVICPKIRYVFHMEPSLHEKVTEVSTLILQWWATIIRPRLKPSPWTMMSNVWFHGMDDLFLFPQQCPYLCRAWVWIMALTIIYNRVESAQTFLSVLNVLTRFRIHLLKIFLMFHVLIQPRPPSCSERCDLNGRLRYVAKDLKGIKLKLLPRLIYLNLKRGNLRVSRSRYAGVFIGYYEKPK